MFYDSQSVVDFKFFPTVSLSDVNNVLNVFYLKFYLYFYACLHKIMPGWSSDTQVIFQYACLVICAVIGSSSQPVPGQRLS